jgi:hypothetical protein
MAHLVCRCGAGYYSKNNDAGLCEQCRKALKTYTNLKFRPALRPELLPHGKEIEFKKGSTVYNIALMVMDTIRNQIVNKTSLQTAGYKVTVEKINQ